MINKIYKIIHNSYLKFFKLFLFLRYIFLIFLIAISLFISIPKFFDYEKKSGNIRDILIKNYNLFSFRPSIFLKKVLSNTYKYILESF